MSELAETVELLVSEIMTNAVKAARVTEPLAMEPVPPVQFWLLSDNKRVMVMAWDANPKAPMPRDANIEAEGGRGLVLVDALSEEWNWYRVPELGGKVVWAVCALPDSMEPRR